ncbi:MAG TPA: acyl-CoA dehydrogenase family protein [Vicinamibacterales bacterium]|jgi:alkylation response protein AidB-like acyl-CoA dehydrogenase|nr:acyl-CoA dehydrogenase family protein [Vicinamibacterales bacterium]
MDFELTEDQELLKRAVREFADGEIAPGAAERDEHGRFPSELVPKLASQGLLGILVPDEYGGAGYDAIGAAIILEEIARVDAAVALLVGSHNSLCSGHILAVGTEDQKRTFLPPLARGEKLGAWALTEPGSGSDAGAMRTRATLDGGSWVIRGDKQFITQGSMAGTYVVIASTDPSLGTKGISAFIVPRETPGLNVGKIEKKLGVCASDTAALHFDDMRVPRENLLGKMNEGFKDVLGILSAARIGMAAMAVGIARGAFDEALKYARGRRQFGKPILEYEAIQWMLADMATEIDAARLLAHKAATLKDSGQPFLRTASQAKLHASEVVMRATSKAIQIHGGYGYLKDSPVERFYRDAKLCEIGEGTSEVQRMVIARDVLK